MNRKAIIQMHGKEAGILEETDQGYQFTYSAEWLKSRSVMAISLTLPLQTEPFVEKTMIPFFDGLIPEGWLLDIATETWKINPRDRMGLLMVCCKDCIGAVSIIPKEPDNAE